MKKRNDLAWAILAVGILLLLGGLRLAATHYDLRQPDDASKWIGIMSVSLLLMAYATIRLLRTGENVDVIACPGCGRKNSVHTKICPRCGRVSTYLRYRFVICASVRRRT